MKYSPLFVIIATMFVLFLIMANLLSGAREIALPGLPNFDAGTITFPVAYILDDVLTEVYGYKMARLVIWLGFLSNLIFQGFIALASLFPDAFGADHAAAYNTILGTGWQILAASFAAYLVGEFSNSFILAKMKIWTKGRFLWTRTIGSTIIGEGLDSLIFGTVAASVILGPGYQAGDLAAYIVFQWLFKTSYETVATPLTYLVITWLKKVEQSDVYDYNTDFNPLKLRFSDKQATAA